MAVLVPEYALWCPTCFKILTSINDDYILGWMCAYYHTDYNSFVKNCTYQCHNCNIRLTLAGTLKDDKIDNVFLANYENSPLKLSSLMKFTNCSYGNAPRPAVHRVEGEPTWLL